MGSFYSLVGEKTFLGWEPNIPSVGIKRRALVLSLRLSKKFLFRKNLSISQQISQNLHKHRTFAQ